MKNKELYCRCLLFLIVILIIITNVYAFIKFNIYKEEKTIVSEKKEKNENVNYGVPSGEVGMKLPTSYDEIESILKDRQYIAIPADGVVTFSDLSADSALCVKYKKIGAPNSPNTGDVAYVLPVAAVALISLGLMIIISRKRRNVKA